MIADRSRGSSGSSGSFGVAGSPYRPQLRQPVTAGQIWPASWLLWRETEERTVNLPITAVLDEYC